MFSSIVIHFKERREIFARRFSLVGEYDSEGATPRFARLEKFNINFSNSSFVIRVNLLHPSSS